MREFNKFFDLNELDTYGKQMLNMISKSYQNIDRFSVFPKV